MCEGVQLTIHTKLLRVNEARQPKLAVSLEVGKPCFLNLRCIEVISKHEKRLACGLQNESDRFCITVKILEHECLAIISKN